MVNMLTAAKFMAADASKTLEAQQLQVRTYTPFLSELMPGDVFFAFAQPDYRNNCFNGHYADGHDNILAAFARGASYCVGRSDGLRVRGAQLHQFRNRLVRVDDAIRAFQLLARGIYNETALPVVAITGSAGKTTTKDLVANILGVAGERVLKTPGNYNNGIGLPWTVLKLNQDPNYSQLVLEMGMSSPDREIARLCEVCPPHVSVVLNVLPVHLEHLGSLEAIARAKSEIVAGQIVGASTVLNRNDPHVWQMRRQAKGELISFGITPSADVTAEKIQVTPNGQISFAIKTPIGSSPVSMRMRGLPNILNALAASAVAVSRGVPVEAIARGLGIARSSPRRGQWLSFQEGFTVIDDTYNSNEHALLCAVQTMREYQGKHVRLFLVAGEMAEIGMTSQEVHRRCGFALGSLVDIVWGVCGAAIHLVEGARNAGARNTMMFENAIVAADALRAEVRDGDLILIKGSRSARMEVVVDLLLTHFHCLPDVELGARC